MTDRQVECLVNIPQDKAVGEYANAFRVVHDAGEEWFLDFLVYSESEQIARLVVRIRVLEPMLDSILARLKDCRQEKATRDASILFMSDIN